MPMIQVVLKSGQVENVYIRPPSSEEIEVQIVDEDISPEVVETLRNSGYWQEVY